MNKNSYILITGGAGYIGCHLNQLLSRAGYKTIVLDNLSNGHRDLVQWGEFVEADLLNPSQIRRVFADFPVEVVMHMAAFAYVHESVLNPRKYYTNNVIGALNLLEAMVDCHVPYLVFSSSCATYGILNEVPVKEDHPQRPINPYGDSKLMVEKIIREYVRVHSLKACVLRYFNAAGADLDAVVGERHVPETHLIPLVLDVALGKKATFQINGDDYETEDGTCIRDYIHVVDIAQAHIQAMGYMLSGGSDFAFNLSNGSGYSIRQVIEMVHQVTGAAVRTQIMPRRPGDPPILIGDSARARKILNWAPRHEDLRSIIESAWKWHCKDAAVR